MNRPYLRAILIASITFLLGSGIDALTGLETALGLDSLFQIRGNRTPPAEAVVVAMDESSETRLGVGTDLTRWRGFHAQLIRQFSSFPRATWECRACPRRGHSPQRGKSGYHVARGNQENTVSADLDGMAGSLASTPSILFKYLIKLLEHPVDYLKYVIDVSEGTLADNST